MVFEEAIMAAWYQLSVKEVFELLNTSEKGLGDEEVENRILKYGKNRVVRKRRKSAGQILLEQVKSFMMIILFFSVAISLVVGEILDALLLLLVLTVNIVSGFFLEFKAEKAFEELEKMTVNKARVTRRGRDLLVDAEEMVPGDVVIFEEGDKVPADLRLFECHNLKIDESILTGESIPSVKYSEPMEEEVSVADMENMAFAGTVVAYGRGKGVVVGTGVNTEFGKISEMVQEAVEETPLQRRLNYLGKILLSLSAILALIIFASGIARGEEFMPLLMYVVSLTVSAVPEALPTVTTLALAIGAIEIARRNAVVRKLPIIETLGSIDVICSDKTGTLTKNEMTVRRVLFYNRVIEVEGTGYNPRGNFLEDEKKIDPLGDEDLIFLLRTAFLCNSASLIFSEESKRWEIIGDPTEGALLVLAEKAGLPRILEKHERIHEIPFSSARKRRVTADKIGNELCSHIVGAPEVILELSNRIVVDGTAQRLTDADKLKISEECDQLARDGFRLLALGYKNLEGEFVPKSLEEDLTFIGVVGMIDPPKQNVKRAVKECFEAGIRPVMITGDHRLTALAVAEDIGMSGEILEGVDIERMSDETLAKVTDKVAVYARTSPEHKVRIVQALKRRGHTVAITGDGVNDAPVLKTADVGIAMGIMGSDVTREASDMVLRDDNFATIVTATKYGRSIYDNLKNFFMYSLLGNFDELYLVITCFLLGLPFPITALQILWINLLTDAFSGLALAFEPPREEALKEPPRNPRESMLKPVILRSASYGLLALVFELMFFMSGLRHGVEKARTLVFMFCVFFELTAIFSIRTEKIFNLRVKNTKLVLAVIASAILQLATMYTPLRNVLEVTPLTLSEITLILLTCVLCFFAMETIKFLEMYLKKQRLSLFRN